MSDSNVYTVKRGSEDFKRGGGTFIKKYSIFVNTFLLTLIQNISFNYKC